MPRLTSLKAVVASEYPDDFSESSSSVPPDGDDEDFDSDSSSSVPPIAKKGANGKVKEQLIRLGKTKGFLTYDDVHEALPGEDVGPDQMEDMLTALDDERIEVVDDVSELKPEIATPTTKIWVSGGAPRRKKPPSGRAWPPRALRRRAATRSFIRATTRSACTCARWGASRS